jgi:hypothetical protein
MLARMMIDEPKTGKCGDQCFVTIGGETHVFAIDDQVKSPDDPCVAYVCTLEGVVKQAIACQKVDCNGEPPIRYPNSCCQTCEGPRDPDGEFEEWGEWTECSVTCGQGRHARRRTCKILENAVEAFCTGQLVQTEFCQEAPCPIDCEWEYGDFEACSTTCGAGVIKRFPIITTHPQHGGMPCPPNVINEEPDEDTCNLRDCPVDCVWEYGDFEECSASCGEGVMMRFPEVIRPSSNGGKPCPTDPEIRPCDAGPCPEDCEWEYDEFGECSASCGTGEKRRFPRIIRPALHGGKECPDHVLNGVPDVDECNTQPCPIDCEWKYGEYGVCSMSCGMGTKQRFPIIIVQPQHGGKQCPVHVINLVPDSETCNDRPCPVDCEWRYGEFEECTKTCDGGTKSRYPIILTQPEHGGKECPPDVVNRVPDTMKCNEIDCPFVCEEGKVPCPKEGGGVECVFDRDGDCVPDEQDNCVDDANPDQADMEYDGVGDICDNCPKYANHDQQNADGDATGDACDGDDDNDERVDASDNCRTVQNFDQKDTDKDGVGDACDNCPDKNNNNQNDADGDDVGNACDNCRFYPNPPPVKGGKQDPNDPKKFGALCTTKPAGMQYYDDDDEEYNEDLSYGDEKKGLAAQIMEKLLDMYYSN